VILNPGPDQVVLTNPTPTTDQFNRVVYVMPLPTLAAGKHTVTYLWQLSNLGCYRNTTNEVHLNQAGVAGHLAVSTISASVNCNLVADNDDAEIGGLSLGGGASGETASVILE
jgi:hypothetical protein